MSNINKKEIKQNKILDAAYEVFVGKGYSDTTMDDIAKKSNMSKGAIYHYYSSKKSLFLALIDHWETYSFPDFYTKNKKNKSASEILKDIADVVYDVFKKKKHVFDMREGYKSVIYFFVNIIFYFIGHGNTKYSSFIYVKLKWKMYQYNLLCLLSANAQLFFTPIQDFQNMLI